MSGLIWAGIGRGIADAGSTFGNAMMRGIEEERRTAAEMAREERLIAREEEREQRKEERLEAVAKKDADIFAEAEKAAPGIGQQRRFEQFKKDVGQTDMSDEELRGVFESQYDQRRVGQFEGADRYLERYSKQKEDVLNEIRRRGGSSGLINQATNVYKSTLEAERASDRLAFDERKDERRAETESKKLEALMGYRDRMAGAAETRASAAVTAANRPPAAARSGLSGMSEVKLNQEAETLRKAAKDASNMDTRREYEARLREVMDEIQARRKGSATAPRSGDNAGSRPPIDSFLKR